MARAYSEDLRERVVAACDRGGRTHREVAEVFGVSESWVRRLLRRRREAGTVAARPRRGGRRPAFDAEAAERLRAAAAERPGATLRELAEAAGVRCSTSAVDRALRRLGVARPPARPPGAGASGRPGGRGTLKRE